jgi:integrase/recombinase XerD
VTTKTLVEWLSNPDYSPWTRVTYFGHIRSYFGWLYETGQIPTNPAADLKSPRQPKSKPRPLTESEVVTVMAAATGNVRAWLMLGLLAGMRSHEMAKLRGEDIDERSIFILGKGQQQAFVPTHPALWEIALTHPAGYWFPSRRGSKIPHIAGTSISGVVTRHFQKLGIEGSSHRCRHSYATNLLRNGANIRVVQTLMRHESLATTAKYTAVDEDERMLAIASLVA